MLSAGRGGGISWRRGRRIRHQHGLATGQKSGWHGRARYYAGHQLGHSPSHHTVYADVARLETCKCRCRVWGKKKCRRLHQSPRKRRFAGMMGTYDTMAMVNISSSRDFPCRRMARLSRYAALGSMASPRRYRVVDVRRSLDYVAARRPARLARTLLAARSEGRRYGAVY